MERLTTIALALLLALPASAAGIDLVQQARRDDLASSCRGPGRGLLILNAWIDQVSTPCISPGADDICDTEDHLLLARLQDPPCSERMANEWTTSSEGVVDLSGICPEGDDAYRWVKARWPSMLWYDQLMYALHTGNRVKLFICPALSDGIDPEEQGWREFYNVRSINDDR